jgi:hypothetical protein
MLPILPYTAFEQRAQAEWLTVRRLAIVLSINNSNARKSCVSGEWQGHALEVAKVPSPGGFAYLIKSSSLPMELQERLAAVQGPVNDPLPAAPAQGDFEPRVSPKTPLRLALMKPVLATAPGSPERSAAIASAAASGRVSKATVRRWLARHEELGAVGPARKRRVDSGQRRAITWSSLDDRLLGAGWSEAAIEELAEQLKGLARGLWAAGMPSGGMIAQAMIGLVAEKLRAAGVAVPATDLAVCRPPRHFVWAHRRYSLVNVHRNDAGLFADKHEPRVRRARPHLLPMQWVAMDGVHLDVAIRRPDGSIATPKMVIIVDLATMRVFWRVWLLPKGEMLRREHVIAAFISMCSDLSWGVPSRVLIDRGGEFSTLGLAEDLFQLKQRVAVEEVDLSAAGVHWTLPYGPEGKVAKTVIAMFQRHLLACIEAWIAGNRMRKKTQSRGREPAAWRRIRAIRAGAGGCDSLLPRPGAIQAITPARPVAERPAAGVHRRRLAADAPRRGRGRARARLRRARAGRRI